MMRREGNGGSTGSPSTSPGIARSMPVLTNCVNSASVVPGNDWRMLTLASPAANRTSKSGCNARVEDEPGHPVIAPSVTGLLESIPFERFLSIFSSFLRSFGFLVRLMRRFLVPATALIGIRRRTRQGWPQAIATRRGLDGSEHGSILDLPGRLRRRRKLACRRRIL
jgi:hypothetical protein